MHASLYPARAKVFERELSLCPVPGIPPGILKTNKRMKKLGLLVLALCMAVAANAQKGQMALGGNLNFGIDDGYNNVGIGPKFQYNFAEKWRGEASFNYFFEKDNLSQWDINLNVHYIVPIANTKFNFYPLAGLTVLGMKADLGPFGSDSDTNVGFNLGGGFEYYFTEHFKANVEGKLQWADDSRGVIAIGAAYVF